MKQKLKKYLKIGIPLFGILFILNSCLQEDDLRPEQDTAENIDNVAELSIVSSENIPDIINFIKSKSNEEMTFRIQYANNDMISAPNGTDLQQLELSIENLDAITQITNEFDKSNYTFS
jgi:hypothetical protein